MKPLVTVLMPVYNEEKNPLLEKTIKSIYGQTLKNFEIIIIDDCSIDNTVKKILQIKKKYKRKDIKTIIFRNANNLDIAESLNKGINKSMSNFIARIDMGDIMTTERLEKQYRYLTKNNTVFLVGSLTKWIDSKLTIIGEPFNPLKVPKNFSELKSKVLFENYLPHASWMVRKNLFLKIGQYNKQFRCEDYELYVRAISRGFKVGLINETLTYCYGKHFESMGISKIKGSEIANDYVNVKIRYLPKLVSIWNIYGTLKSIPFMDFGLLINDLWKTKNES